MSRILPEDVVEAYKATGAIPIRLAWTTTDERGGCAIDTVARHLGFTTEDLRETLDKRYEDGFLLAWDADDPLEEDIVERIKGDAGELVRQGYCDGLLCRKAVEKVFSSELVPVESESDSES